MIITITLLMRRLLIRITTNTMIVKTMIIIQPIAQRPRDAANGTGVQVEQSICGITLIPTMTNGTMLTTKNMRSACVPKQRTVA